MPDLGHTSAKGTPAANLNYQYAAGVAAVVAVPDGAYLLGLTAWSVAAGATVQIGALATVGVPTGGSFTQDVGGGIRGPVNVTFIGTSQYFVEWLLP